MPAPFSFDDDLALVGDACRLADDLLGGWGPELVAKALDLSTPEAFDRTVASLAGRLRRLARPLELAALRAAVAVLDIDWSRTTAEARARLIDAAMVAAGKSMSTVPEQIGAPLSKAAQAVIAATRRDVRASQKVSIGADFNALDHRVAAFTTRCQGLFVRDEYGRRLDGFGSEARRVVAAGLESGLGRQDLVRDLAQAAETALVQRSSAYWEVVAGAFTGQARSFAQVSSYAEAGIERYRIEAVMDEQTTPTCRFLHGKTFSVGTAVRRFKDVEALERPEDIKAVLPWVRHALDAETGRSVLYVRRGEARVPIAEVTRASSAKDDAGAFRSRVDDAGLLELGLGFPPYHGLCRSTCLPAV